MIRIEANGVRLTGEDGRRLPWMRCGEPAVARRPGAARSVRATYFVDRFDATTLAMIVGIAGLDDCRWCLDDRASGQGSEEVNPIMAHLARPKSSRVPRRQIHPDRGRSSFPGRLQELSAVRDPLSRRVFVSGVHRALPDSAFLPVEHAQSRSCDRCTGTQPPDGCAARVGVAGTQPPSGDAGGNSVARAGGTLSVAEPLRTFEPPAVRAQASLESANWRSGSSLARRKSAGFLPR